ncbi:secreted protein containing Dystroglycan-type cadherin-like domain protein [Candidatus Magnetomorum sp. HK-1]|nr:secreted protein containing Dystroglycan-type cadherin-like domain protein [Candidatus Magnetomorum sp. HK-1]
MQIRFYQALLLLVIFISAISGESQAIDVGPVPQVYSVSHALDIPSSNPNVQVKWLPPESGLQDGYYVTFNTKMAHLFDEFNTADTSVTLIRETQITSQDFSGADDVGYYFHIAAFALDTNDNEYIGPTQTIGPFRIDTVAPLMPVITAPKAIRERMITILPGAFHANEMYISNIGYGENGFWEDFTSQRIWELRDIQGDQMIYALFRDLAGNKSKASAAVRYDTIQPRPEITSSVTVPARTSPIMLTLTFNEPVKGLSETDIQTENCQIQNFVEDDNQFISQYLLECIPQTQGQVRVSILDNIVSDEAGNLNQSGNIFECIYDTSHPEIQPIQNQMIIENTQTEKISMQLTNSNSYNGILTVNAWADMTSLVSPQNIVLNGQSNPLDISFLAKETQVLSLEIIPQQDQSGSTMIHIMVSDATGITDYTSFQLDVWDTPNISAVSNLQMNESTVLSVGIVLTDVYQQNLTVKLESTQPDLVGINHTKLIGNTVLGANFPYICQTSNQSSISVELFIEPPPYQYGTVDLTLTAINAKNLTQSRSFTLNIKQINDSPKIILETSANCFEDQTVEMPVSITDMDQGTLIVSAHAADEQLLPENHMQWIFNNNDYFNPITVPMGNSETQNLVLKLSPTANASGQTTVTVRVEDEGFLFMKKDFIFTVTPVNDPPVSPETMSFTVNENIFSGTVIGRIPANDVDNSFITFSTSKLLPQNHFQVNPSTGDIIAISTIDYETIPFYEMTVKVSDGYSNSTTDVSLVINNLNDNPPVFADKFFFSVIENTPIGTIPYTIIATDEDKDNITYDLVWDTAPSPFAISPLTGQIWIHQTVDYETAQVYHGRVTVSDSVHSEQSPLTITVTNINEKPVISGTPGLTIAQGDYYEFQPITIDPDEGDQLSFYISNKPEWADFDLQTGKLFGIPENQHVGDWNDIILSVRDDNHLFMSLPSFNITVYDTNDPPVIQHPIADVSTMKLSLFSLTIPQDTFVDVDPGDVLTYTASTSNGNPLPEWLSFDSLTLKFTGTPGILDGGVLSIIVTALDQSLAATSDAFLLTIVDLNLKPQIIMPGPDLDYQENSSAVIIDSFARISDDDSSNFDNGYLWVTFDSGGAENDRLEIKDYGFGNNPIGLDKNQIYVKTTLIGSFSGGSKDEPLIIAFNHWADKAAVQSVLRNIIYVNESENPSDMQRRLEFKISDGDGGISASIYKTITMHAINDDPILSINNQVIDESFELQNLKEDQSIIFDLNHNNLLQIDDKDAGNNILTVSITAIKGIFTLNSQNIGDLRSVSGNQSSNVSFSGTLSQINAVLDGMKYSSRLNEFGQEILTVRVKDNGYSGEGGGEYIDRSILFDIVGENDPPVISSIPAQVIDEDSTAQIDFLLTETDQEDVVLKLTSLQPDMICQNSIILSNPLVSKIPNGYFIETSQVASVNLKLSVTPCNDITGEATIVIKASDGTYTQTAQVDITITPINDPPKIQNQSFVVAEDYILSKELSIIDADEDNFQVYLITLPQKGTVELNAENNTFIYTPNKNVYGQDVFTYQAKDYATMSNIGRVDITISPVNDPPDIESIPDQTLMVYQTRTVPFSVTDVDSTFHISVQSDNTQLFPNHPSNLYLVQNGNECSLRLDPVSGQFGRSHITIVVKDTEGLTSQSSFDVWVKSSDDMGPVITLFDESIIQINQNESYHEPGFIAIDDIDGDITAAVETQTDLDIYTPGTYQVTYSVKDQAGNYSAPTERIVIVNKNQFPKVKISGNVFDDTGSALGWVDIQLEGQGKTYKAETIYDGFFEMNTPITLDGTLWRMTLSRSDIFTQTIEFSEPTSFESIRLLNIDSSNAEIIKGQCFKQQVNASPTLLGQVMINARSTLDQEILATTFSDQDGHYTLAVDVRNRPYQFEAIKYGYNPIIFDVNEASAIVMIPITTIIIEKTEHMTDHDTARDMDKVSLSIRANPSFTGSSYELLIEPFSGNSMMPIKLPLSIDQYPIIYNAYEDFILTFRADTTEDRDTRNGYYIEKQIYFKSLSLGANVAVTKGSKAYQVDQPFLIKQNESNDRSFMRIDRGSLVGPNIPKELHYTIRDYTFPLDDILYDHIVEFELSDEFGRDCASNNSNAWCSNICLGIGFEPPVTKNSLNDHTYEIVRAETVQGFLNGDAKPLSDASDLKIYEKNITFCTPHLSVYGFRKKIEPGAASADNDSGGGCFLMSLFSGQLWGLQIYLFIFSICLSLFTLKILRKD